MLKESLLAAALTFPAWYGDVEEPEARTERLETIATAIDQAVQVATCQASADDFAGSDRSAKNEDQSGAADEASSANASSDAGSHEGASSEAPQEEECKPMWLGEPRQLGFLLLGQAFLETRLALHVHQGKCRKGECDSGKAISLWQLQYGPHLPKEEWQTLAGTDVDATRRAALEASRALSRGYNYCRSIPGAISLYATGRHCRWEPAQKRAHFIQGLMERY